MMIKKFTITLSIISIIMGSLFYNNNVYTYNTGSPNGYTGEPPNNWTCGFNPSCHAGNINLNTGVDVVITGNPTSYVEGQTYTITITVDDPLAMCYGFQIGVIDDTNQDGAGTFAIAAGSDMVIESVTTREYVEHNALSMTGVWTFDWTAPSTSVGDITFYTSAVAGQCNNDPLDDAVYTSELKLTPACSLDIEYEMSGYVVLWDCDYSSDVPQIGLNILSVTGGGGEYAIEPDPGNSSVSTTDIVEGEGFTYYFTEADQMNGTLGFTIIDEFGQECVMSPDLITQLNQIPFNIVCFGAPECTTSAIEASFAPGSLMDIYSCDTSDPNSETIIVNVTSTSGGNGNYSITTLGGGTLSAPSVTAPAGFTYTFTQADIDNYQVGFVLDDGSGCTQEYDLTGPVLFWDIAELCDPTPVCNDPLVVTVQEINNAAELTCDFTDPLNPQYIITVTSVTGGDGSYVVTTNGGVASPATLSSGQGFQYFISQADIDAGTVGFTIDDEAACTETQNYAASLAGITISDNCVLTCDITRDIATDGGGFLDYSCDFTGAELSISITVENIAGGSGAYTYTSMVGSITPISANTPGSFTYTVTQADIDSGNTGFTIDDGTVQCGDFENLSALFDTPLEQLCPCEVAFDYLLDGNGNLQASCNFNGPEPEAFVTIQNVSGGSGTYTVNTTVGSATPSTINAGASFIYSFTQAEQNSGNLGFTLDDGFGLCDETDLNGSFPANFVDNFCVIECDVSFGFVTGAGGAITATCDYSQVPTQLIIEIVNITGGDGAYSVTANGGTVSTSSVINGDGFTYSFGQAEIDAGTVGFTVQDDSGNCPATDLNGAFGAFIVDDVCPISCDATVEFAEDAGGQLAVNCDFSGAEPMLVLNIIGITGGSGNYTITPDGGSVSTTTVVENQSFTYTFGQTELDAGTVGFNVNDGNDDCPVPNLNASFAGFSVEDFCAVSCDVAFDYIRDANNNIIASCDFSTATPQIVITVNSITGTAGTYSVSATGGTVSANTVGNGGTFTYSFGQAEIDAGTVGFFIDDASGNCSATDLNGTFGNINVAAFCSGSCPSTTGTLTSTNSTACFGENFGVSTSNYVLVPGQQVFVLLHNSADPAASLPTTVYSSNSGTTGTVATSITNDGTLPSTVYGTAIVANPDATNALGIDLNDPCLYIGTTATFSLNSEISLSVGMPVCDNTAETYDVPFTVTGGTGTYTINAGGTITATDLGGGNYIFEDVPSGTSFSFAAEDSFPCFSNTENVGPVICSLVCNNAVGTLNFDPTACYNETVNTTGTNFMTDAGQLAFLLIHNSPDAANSLPTTVYAADANSTGTLNASIVNDGTFPATVYTTLIVALPNAANPLGIDVNDPCIAIGQTEAITLYPELVATVGTPVCSADFSTFDVDVTISGGSGSGYSINAPANLSVIDNGNGMLTIANAPSGSNYTFFVTDDSNCDIGPFAVGPVTCSPNCTSSAGTVSFDDQTICIGESLVANVSGYSLTTGQEIFLIIHDSPDFETIVPNTTYAISNGTTGVVSATYTNNGSASAVYVTAIAANPLNGNPDLTDDCLVIGSTTPISLLSQLTSTLNPTFTCNAANDGYSAEFSLAGGGGTYTVNASQGTVADLSNGNYSIADIPSDASSTVTFTDQNGCAGAPITIGPFSCEVPCSGADGNVSVDPMTVCDGAVFTSTVSNYNAGPGQTAFLLVHDSSNPAATLPTTIYDSISGTSGVLTLNTSNNGTLPSTVYVTLIVAEPDATNTLGINLNDPCLVIGVTQSVTIGSGISISADPNYICSADLQSYTATVVINGGIPPYTLTSSLGTVSTADGSTYTISGIPNQNSAVLSLVDSNNCPGSTIIVGPTDCDPVVGCTSAAGSVSTNETTICSGESLTGTISGFTLDPGQLAFAVVHDSPTPTTLSPTTVYAVQSSTTGNATVTLTNTFTTSTTVYVSGIAALDDGSGGIDFTDSCLAIGTTIPVTFNPALTFALDDTYVCSDDAQSYSAQFTVIGGSAAYNITTSQGIVNSLGGSLYEVSGINSGSTATINIEDQNGCPGGALTVGPHNCEVTSTCDADAGTISISSTEICAGEAAMANVDGYLLDDGQIAYLVFHDSPNPSVIPPVLIFGINSGTSGPITLDLINNGGITSTVYATGIIAADGGGIPDFNDECIEYTNTVEVNLYMTVLASASNEYLCTADNLSYSTGFMVEGGTGNNTVTSSQGTVVDNGNGSYTVAGIPSGQEAVISLSSDCANETISLGTNTCETTIECNNDIGDFMLSGTEICFGNNVSAMTVGYTLDNGQVVVVLIHDSASPAVIPPSNIYAINSGNAGNIAVNVSNDGSLPSFVYATAIIATPDIGHPLGVDIDDPCILFSATTAIQVGGEVTYSQSANICSADGLTYSTSATVSGVQAGYSATASAGTLTDDGNGNISISNIPSTTVVTLNIVDNTCSSSFALTSENCTEPCLASAATISADANSICLGEGDIVNVTVTDPGVGTNLVFVITDATGTTILDGPTASTQFNFDAAPPGNCLIWAVTHDGTINIPTDQVADITGCFALSNSWSILRENCVDPCLSSAATIAADANSICLGEGDVVNVSIIDAGVGPNLVFVVTDASGTTILDGPTTSTQFNFDGAPAGTCLIWAVTHDGTINIPTNQVADITGCFALSNSWAVTREDCTNPCLSSPATITADANSICLGEGDLVNVAITDFGVGPNLVFVVTDATGTTILDGPTNTTQFNFDGAPPGTCLIWAVTHDGTIDIPTNQVADITGCFALSNSWAITREDCAVPCLASPATIFADDNSICLGDGEIVNVTVSNPGVGPNLVFVVTDNAGATILAGPTTDTQFTFDGAPPGTCLIWAVTHDGTIDIPTNQVADITGCFALSNSWAVSREDCTVPCLSSAAMITADSNSICLGEGDVVNVTVTDAGVGPNLVFVVTDGTGTTILDGPTTNTQFNFDGAPAGTCLIWAVTHDGTINIPTNQVADITGCFALSNSWAVTREDCTIGICEANAGTVTPPAQTVVCNDNGFVGAATITGQNTAYDYLFVLTDVNLNFVAISATGGFDLTGISPGSYCVHGLSYDASSTDAPNLNVTNAADLLAQTNACFDLIVDACYTITVQDCVPPVCEANAGTLIAPAVTTACPTGSFIAPNVVGQNTAYDYLFVLTDASLNIVDANTTGAFSAAGLALGDYCVHGLSYDASSPNAPNLNVANAADLLSQTSSCFDLIVAECYTLTVEDCTVQPTCEANAGTVTAPSLTTVCNNAGFVAAPQVSGANTAYDYLFVLTNASLNIISTSSNGAFDLTGALPGDYCVHGLSFDADASNAPNLNITNAADLLNQTNACFDLIVADCYTITVQDCGTNVDCDANAGNLLPIFFDTFCTENAMVTLPLEFGQNPTFDYLFVVTNSNLEIVATESTGSQTIDVTGLPGGDYCIHGLSYDADSPDAPNLNITNVSELFAQTDACFDLIVDGCVPLTIQDSTVNDAPPVGPSDTLYLCTEYVTPIDFCIDISDPDGGDGFLVEIVSFCNPEIIDDSCVHYPPLPGLMVGDTEVISLIYCDDDCPQLCDTSYVSITIIGDDFDCPDVPNPTVCNPDTIIAFTEGNTPIDLCLDCDNTNGYAVQNVNTLFDGTISGISGTCFTYTSSTISQSQGYDIIEALFCQDGMTNCVTQVFDITISEDPIMNCPDVIYACTPPVVPLDICIDCELDLNPNLVIVEVESLFDHCTINVVGEMCFEYIPLPLILDFTPTDTVLVTYCDEITGQCDEITVIMTFEDCDNVIVVDPDPDPIDPPCDEVYTGCTPPIVPFDFCLTCELDDDPNIQIIEVSSLFDCGLDNIVGGCFTYTPLPAMDLVPADTVTIVYCDMNNAICDTTQLIMTFVDCMEMEAPNAEDDFTGTNQDEEVEIEILQNDDMTENTEVEIEIIDQPLNGVTVIEDNSIVYIPNDDYVGIDVFTYEICNDMGCDQASVNIIVKTEGQLNDMDIVIYPIPANENINVLFGADSDADINIGIYNAIGKLIINENYSVDKGIHHRSINTANLPNGIYFINVVNGDYVQVKKLLIE